MSDVCVLPDSRELGFARIGNPDGPQIFYTHGLPGSRLEGKCFYEKHLHKFGAGIISVDRPGLGLSSPHPGRTISDHARDVLYLAKRLGLREWWVIGVSGGGPYALACARHHPPECLKGVAICAGSGPYEFGYQGMGTGTKAMALCFRFAPWLMHIFYRPIVFIQNMLSNERQVDILQKNFQTPSKSMQIQDKDVEVFKGRELLMNITISGREHFRQGFGGFVQDGAAIEQKWDFNIEDIPFGPIYLWHGKRDVNCPMHFSEKTAALLGDKAELHVVDETHLSTSVNCAEDILAHLLGESTALTT